MTADLAWAIACAVFLLGMAGLIGVAVWDHRNCPKCKARRQRCGKVIPLAKGGIVTRPTAGPEAVIPLSRPNAANRPRLCAIRCRCCGARWAAADPVASWRAHCTFQRAEWVGTLPMWISK